MSKETIHVQEGKMDKSINFRDVIGPVMIGPSSSHTAGACRIGNYARAVHNHPIAEVLIELHGSFAKTYRGHGTDRAIIGGLLGFSTDDPRIIDAMTLAEAQGLRFEFRERDLGPVHPNTARISFYENGRIITRVMGSSIGGGQVRIIDIDGIKTNIDGKLWSMIATYKDRSNMIMDITTVVSRYGLNIAAFSVTREAQDATMMAAFDAPVPDALGTEILQVFGIETCRIIPALS